MGSKVVKNAVNANVIDETFLSCDDIAAGSQGGPNFITNWARPCEKSVRGIEVTSRYKSMPCVTSA